MAAGAGLDVETLILARQAVGPMVVEALRKGGVEATTVRAVREALGRVQARAPHALFVDLFEGTIPHLAELRTAAPSTRLIALVDGDPLAEAALSLTDCVVLGAPTASTLLGALGPSVALDVETTAVTLLGTTVFGGDYAAAKRQLAGTIAVAFGADDCALYIAGEPLATRAELSAEQASLLLNLSASVRMVGAPVISSLDMNVPYRAFLAVPLTHEGGDLGALMLCNAEPRRFDRTAKALLETVAHRIAIDLSWRRVHDRLLADREHMRELARVDAVIGVGNRAALDEELPERIVACQRRGENISVAILDVDGLRLINQRHGYPVGDAVLSHLARTARREVRGQDVVARYAGDAVALLLPGASAERAVAIVERILRAVDDDPITRGRAEVPLTVSAGVAEILDENDSGQAALGRAMAARMLARKHGRVIEVADAQTSAAPASPELELGATLGGVYLIRHEISRGAFGVVYRAEDIALGRHCALKILRHDLSRDKTVVERFRSEAVILARIRNPNLVQVYSFGVEGQAVYFAMELIEGQALDDRINEARRRRSWIPVADVLTIVDQVAGALDAVHEAGIVHRDVKPENILFDRVHRRYVLIDVGVAARRGEKNPAGTPGFTAPEVFTTGNEGPWTDVYSLAAVAYCLLALDTPFAHAGAYKVLERQLQAAPRPLSKFRRDLPPAVAQILADAMDPQPSTRPQSARAFAKALSAALGVKARPTRQAAASQAKATIPAAAPPPPRAVAEDISIDSIDYLPSDARPSPWAPSLTPPPQEPSSRGILFRSAYPLLGPRRGGSWLHDVTREHADLAAALGAHTSPLSWHPTSALITLLRSLDKTGVRSRELAVGLGQAALESSFAIIYGADPSAVSPAEVLRAADMFWRGYHNWGLLTVAARDTEAEVLITNPVPHRLLCACTEGLLLEAIALSGGLDARITHPKCAAESDDRCLYRISWRLAEP